MYKTEIDGSLLFQTGLANGIQYCEDPMLNLSVNAVDSFEFTVYPQNRIYEKIGCMKSLVKIWQDEKLLYYGRITGYSESMYGARLFYSEGALAWLNDEPVPVYSISSMTPEQALRKYIEMYNTAVKDKSHCFRVGTVTVEKVTESGNVGTIHRSSTQRPSYWSEINEKLIKPLGGFLRITYTAEPDCAGIIDWLAEPNEMCDQEIRYTKNLMNCEKEVDGTEIITAVVPLGRKTGAQNDGNDVRDNITKQDDNAATSIIASFVSADLVKSGDMIYSKSGVEQYGFIRKTVVWDDEDHASLLHTAAQWLLGYQSALHSIDVEAIDIADVQADISHFKIGTNVKVYLPGETVPTIMPITTIEIPMSDPSSSRIQVGIRASGITEGASSGTSGGIANSGNSMPSSGIKYELKKFGSTISLKGSDGSESTVADSDTVYTHPTHTPHSKGFYKFANDGQGHVSDAEKVTKKDITDLGIPGQD
ncbi:phage tail protein, partial [Ruminococcus sp.]|uniref:phage tail protein n=1 Tax=Ruminococcus sp. TaxID=41978 RepID=UPI0025E9BE4E